MYSVILPTLTLLSPAALMVPSASGIYVTNGNHYLTWKLILILVCVLYVCVCVVYVCCVCVCVVCELKLCDNN